MKRSLLLALARGIRLLPSVKAGMRVATLGDSITAQNYGLYSQADSMSEEFTGTGFNLLNAEYGHPFLHPVAQDYGNHAENDSTRRGYNKGVSGNTTTQMLARIAEVTNLDPKPDLVFFMGGTNDIENAVDLITIQANISVIAEEVFSLGAIFVIYTVLPRNSVDGSGDWNPSDAVGKMLALNDWIRAQTIAWNAAGREVILVDPYPYFNDGTDNAKTGYTKDGVHPSAKGTQLGILPALRAAFDHYELTSYTRHWLQTPFDASMAPYGNQLPSLSGTDGDIDTAASGTVATDWRVGNNGSAGALTYACTKVVSPVGGSDEWQRIDITSDGTGSAGSTEQCQFRPDPVQNFNGIVGEWYVMRACMHIYAAGDPILNAAYAYLDDRTDDRKVYGGLLDADDGVIDLTRPITRMIQTPYVQAGSNGPDWRPEIRLNCRQDIAGSVSVAIGRCVLHRLETAPNLGG